MTSQRGLGVLFLAAAVALLGAADGMAQGTSGARIGSAGFNSGTLVGSIGAGFGLSGGNAQRANRIRDVIAPYEGQEPALPARQAQPPAPVPPPQ